MAETADGDGSFNLSGCYELATELLDAKAVNNYYTFTGCPWYFRKILVAAQKRLEDIVIQVRTGEEQKTRVCVLAPLTHLARRSTRTTPSSSSNTPSNSSDARTRITASTASSASLRICGARRSGMSEQRRRIPSLVTVALSSLIPLSLSRWQHLLHPVVLPSPHPGGRSELRPAGVQSEHLRVRGRCRGDFGLLASLHLRGEVTTRPSLSLSLSSR